MTDSAAKPDDPQAAEAAGGTEGAATPAVSPAAPSDQTAVIDPRQALDAHRAEMRTTADRLGKATRHALDIRARFRDRLERDPVRTVAYAAGGVAAVAYLVAGGPSKTMRAIRRKTRGFRDGERAYEALPGGLRSMVDASVPGFGGGREEARREMALAILAWRKDPKNRRRADQMVSEILTPPGPSRVFWIALEAALATAATMVIRGIVLDATRRTLSGGTHVSEQPFGPSGASPAGAAPPAPPGAASYTGWSGRRPSAPTEPDRKP
jgi:hypothetical protein